MLTLRTARKAFGKVVRCRWEGAGRVGHMVGHTVHARAQTFVVSTGTPDIIRKVSTPLPVLHCALLGHTHTCTCPCACTLYGFTYAMAYAQHTCATEDLHLSR